jgi:uncharacterized membrane protein YeaQ/YmgE (transglycosylase-associated protein family)
LVDAGFVAGLIAGWLVGQIIRGTGCDLVADICIGIIDALIGSWPVPNEASTPAPGSRRPLPAPPSAPSRFWSFLGSSTDGADGRLADIAATIKEVAVLTLVIGILIIVVIGAILFWVIDKFCPDARLAQLLKLLVVLVCLAAIVNRLLPLLGYPSAL